MPRFGGASLFFLSSHGTGDGLWRYQDGQAYEIWKGADGALSQPPAVSPDGRWVVVALRREDGLRVYAGPVEEGENARARRLDAFLTFYGPGGFATPDDVEALELVQQGLANWAEDRWSEMSRGMGKEGEQLNSDEHHLRIFWRRWNELMGVDA